MGLLELDSAFVKRNGNKENEIRSIDLDWEPYVSVSDCEEPNVECTVEGFTVDMVDLIATQLNFTYYSTKVKSFNMFICIFLSATCTNISNI